MNPTIDWNITIKTILQEKCILVVGPEVFTVDQNPIEKQLRDSLMISSDNAITEYEDGLYFFKEPSYKTRFCYRLEDFYENKFETTKGLFDKLARIPFHFILNLTPDKLLFSTLHESDNNYDYDFYWKNHPPSIEKFSPSKNQPLVYNMFGSIDEHESLVLTHNDLYDYFESIFQSQSMHNNLKCNIRDANNLVFLGVRFDRWYMQILLRILYLHTNKKILKYAANLNIEDNIRTLCYDHFRISIIPAKIDEFIDKLYEECDKQGVLKKLGDEQKTYGLAQRKNNIKQLLAADNIEESIDEIYDLVKVHSEPDKEELENLLLIIQGRRTRLQKKIMEGGTDNATITRDENRIRTDLLNLVNQIS